MIIDFHTHTFPEKIADRALEELSQSGGIVPQLRGTTQSLTDSMKKYGVDKSVNLTVMTRADQVEKVHNKIIDNQQLEEAGIITFGGMHPDYSNYREEIRRLKKGGIRGIKIHPAFAGVNIDDIRFMRILAAASEQDMIVVTHAGYDISYLGENYASVKQIENVMEQVKPTRLVLAHMGGWQDWKLVSERLAGMPLWLDTAFSLGRLHVREARSLLYENHMDITEFVTLVRKHGVDKVLFGTDSPWEKQGDYIEMIRNSGLNSDEITRILGDNALKLLKM